MRDSATPVFHVTYIGRLPGIADLGLQPGQPASIGATAYDTHRARGVFLSEADAVLHWFVRAEAFAEHNSDDVMADGLVPVVVRTFLDPALLPVDDVANEETPYDNWISPEPIAADELQVWDGEEWLDVSDWEYVDAALAVDWVDDDEMEEGGYWQFESESGLRPDDEEMQRQ